MFGVAYDVTKEPFSSTTTAFCYPPGGYFPDGADGGILGTYPDMATYGKCKLISSKSARKSKKKQKNKKKQTVP